MIRIACHVALLSLLAACSAPPPDPTSNWLSGDETKGYAQPDPQYRLQFPADHGPHPAFRLEWWYTTLHLRSDDGRPFGAQLALFRLALRPGPSPLTGWHSPQLYLAHLAISDIEAQRFDYRERYARPVLELAGSESAPLHVWVENCGLRQAQDPAARFARDIDCDIDGLGLHLQLRSERPPALQGDAGYSRKSAEPGNASHYYSQPMLSVHGELRRDGTAIPVRGSGWFDHEWSSQLLSADQPGWDWLGLQLQDGRALMLFRIRSQHGVPSTLRGSLMDAQGRVHAFETAPEHWQPQGHWTSPHSGVRYPLEWRLQLPQFDLDLYLRPRLQDQELNTSIRYWEGSVEALDRGPNGEVRGLGYLELTGYGTSK